jgi:hypothetical protein
MALNPSKSGWVTLALASGSSSAPAVARRSIKRQGRVTVEAFADLDFQAPSVSVYEERKRRWVFSPAEVMHIPGEASQMLIFAPIGLPPA